MKAGLIAIIVLFSLSSTAAGILKPDDDYVLFRMTNGAVIQMKSGTKGDAVRLLTNPETRTIGSEAIPFAPPNAVWAEVPDDSYQTQEGTTFVIHDGKITSVINRVGADVSDPDWP